jgi:hypothetical protein
MVALFWGEIKTSEYMCVYNEPRLAINYVCTPLMTIRTVIPLL